MKKLLLSLGAVAAVAAPVAAVVACGSTTDSKLDTIKKAAISSLDQFTGLTPANKTIAINAINAAKDEAGVTAATQAATESIQPGTPAGTETKLDDTNDIKGTYVNGQHFQVKKVTTGTIFTALPIEADAKAAPEATISTYGRYIDATLTKGEEVTRDKQGRNAETPTKDYVANLVVASPEHPFYVAQWDNTGEGQNGIIDTNAYGFVSAEAFLNTFTASKIVDADNKVITTTIAATDSSKKAILDTTLAEIKTILGIA